MHLAAFHAGTPLTLSTQLQLHLVSNSDYALAPYASDMLRLLHHKDTPGHITAGTNPHMLEIATATCNSPAEIQHQLTAWRQALLEASDQLNISVVGGGTHPLQSWQAAPPASSSAPRPHTLPALHAQWAQPLPLLGQYIQIGCIDGNSALYLLHGLSRYVPHLLALSASSPYAQGYDTGFESARHNACAALPLSGYMPFLLTWRSLEAYFEKVAATGLVQHMDECLWDICPLPTQGSLQIRVCDSPLTIERASALTAYVQALAAWLMDTQPFKPNVDDYLVYSFNRFEAARFGLDAMYAPPTGGHHLALSEHILQTIEHIAPYAARHGGAPALQMLKSDVALRHNDAKWLRERQRKAQLFGEVTRQAALRFRGKVF